MLNYGEPQILELFKNTLPSKLYWILFPINNLRDAVEAMKRVLCKAKLDKHLSGQAVNITPFLKMGETTNSGKEVSNTNPRLNWRKDRESDINDVQDVYTARKR